MIAAFLLGVIGGAIGMFVFANWWHYRNNKNQNKGDNWNE